MESSFSTTTLQQPQHWRRREGGRKREERQFSWGGYLAEEGRVLLEDLFVDAVGAKQEVALQRHKDIEEYVEDVKGDLGRDKSHDEQE